MPKTKFINLILLCGFVISFFACKQETPDTSSHQSIEFENITQLKVTQTTDEICIYNHPNFSIPSLCISQKKLPFTKIVLLTSSPAGYLDQLNAIDHITAAYNTEWIYNPTLAQRIQQGLAANGQNSIVANYEQILSWQPDLVISSTNPNHQNLFQQLIHADIPVILIDEHLENSPLARAEYIKLYGILTGKDKLAQQEFSHIQEQYHSLSRQATQQSAKPSVFAEIQRGDTWHMPGAHSYLAQLLNDAGANYLFTDNTAQGAIPLSFERVYNTAQNADYWVNAADFHTYQQLADAHSGHTLFQAYKNHKVYAIAGRINHTGASDYFESGAVRADLLLADYVKIFHPHLVPNHTFTYVNALQ
ncbi:MAG: ABC transporter substrate-binding protein [Weeksellaceae bacterium]|nr:ABC transporter substrate-binding protein [Weeksellaceae bacterium]